MSHCFFICSQQRNFGNLRHQQKICISYNASEILLKQEITLVCFLEMN